MGPRQVMLAHGWVCVPLPGDLGWGDRGRLRPNSGFPWPLDSEQEQALLVLLLGPGLVLVSREAQLLGLGAEEPFEDSSQHH